MNFFADKKIWITVTVAISLLTVGALFVRNKKENQNSTPFTFSMLNVGQGDALLVQSNTGETLLIDGGPDSQVLSELKKTLPRNDKTIETVILTHPDLDHIGGLLSVIDYYRVNRILVSGLKATSSHSQSFAKKISHKKIPLISADMHSDFQLNGVGINGAIETMTVDILYPWSPIIFSHEDANNDSIVARLEYRGHTILAMGDAEAPVEEQLRTHYRHKELDVEILKLGHHGSKTSSTPDFVKTASPRIALASMAKNNSFHHPSPSIVKEMRRFGIPLLTTAANGRITIQFYFDGGLKITCESGCTE